MKISSLIVHILLTLFLITGLGCLRNYDFDNKASPQDDAVAKSLVPEENSALVYIIFNKKEGNCGKVWVWLNEQLSGGFGRGTYLYARVTPGAAVIKLQDRRKGGKNDEYDVVQTNTIHTDFKANSINFIELQDYSHDSKRGWCIYDKFQLRKLNKKDGRLALQQSFLSDYNVYDFIRKGKKPSGGSKKFKRKDYCEGNKTSVNIIAGVLHYCLYNEYNLSEADFY